MFGARWKHVVAFVFAVAAMVWAAPAMAAGSVKLVKSTVEESDGAWKLKFTIDYGKKPHLAHIPMVFTFKQTALYERSLTDDSPDTPVLRTVPVRNAEPNNVSVDVGFADAKGEMFKVTKFSIKLRRDADFEAGEYELSVKESASGRKIGRKIRIKLNGKNKIINRKAMEFSAPKPKPKPEKTSMEDVPEDEGPVAAEDRGPDLSDIPDVVDDDSDVPGKVEPKQGGCGCEVVAPRSTTPAWLALGLVGFAVARRRSSMGGRRR